MAKRQRVRAKSAGARQSAKSNSPGARRKSPAQPSRAASRVPVLSLVVDAAYGALPAPFFVLPSGELAPDAMMRLVPGPALVLAAVGVACGLAVAGSFVSPVFAMAALVPVAVHWFLFAVHGYPYQSEKLFDLAGQLGFTAMSAFSAYRTPGYLEDPRKQLAACLCLLWSVRLGYYLFARFLERGEDFRFVRARKHPGYHFFAWTMQGVWCFLQGLSLLLLNEHQPPAPSPLGVLDLVGVAVWFASLSCESVSDIQKLGFVRRFPVRSKRPFIRQGLWAYSRHPNFAGEVCRWRGRRRTDAAASRRRDAGWGFSSCRSRAWTCPGCARSPRRPRCGAQCSCSRPPCPGWRLWPTSSTRASPIMPSTSGPRRRTFCCPSGRTGCSSSRSLARGLRPGSAPAGYFHACAPRFWSLLVGTEPHKTGMTQPPAAGAQKPAEPAKPAPPALVGKVRLRGAAPVCAPAFITNPCCASRATRAVLAERKEDLLRLSGGAPPPRCLAAAVRAATDLCAQTKAARDKCCVENGPDHCQELIDKHKQCLRADGFEV
jgi:steroid 5-alpha reductase family enzyme